MTLAKLAEQMNAGFTELRKDIKDINDRLDYIVKANDLKDIPERK